MDKNKIESILSEERKFTPARNVSTGAHISSMEDYFKLYSYSIKETDGFWSNVAGDLVWFKKWDKVLDDSDKPFYKWFVNGKTNISYNCLDRHLGTGAKNKAAIIWEGEPGDKKTLTYLQLYKAVNVFANALKKLGIKKGDRIAIYLPMIPELAISVLASARIGAVHSVIFAGFSADSIRERVLDSGAKLVITADGGWRKGNILPLKSIVDESIDGCECVNNVVVVKRAHGDSIRCHIKQGRDHWYHELIDGLSSKCEAEEMDSEDMLFLLYTSGTTGKPKGIIHTTGGYMVYTYITSKYVFDLKESDIYWCTADIGWVTGHSYIVYGPLSNGATVFMYEGAPNWPDKGRFWKLIDDYSITIFYTAPTAIRSFMKWGDEWPAKYDLSSLRLLGTVGEPINPEAWIWYHNVIGKGKCPIVDTWWQTETGGIMITPLPGATPTKPGSATLPFFGIEADILSDDGSKTDAGILAISKPWPGMLRGIYGDETRYRETYWSKWPEIYFPGDGARRDKDGYFWILGRIDDVVNVAGHRIGTAELESVFVEHNNVAESAVIGIEHEIKGQCLVGFISLKEGVEATGSLAEELKNWAAKKIGKFAIPDKIIFAVDLPKTRSGKIMRRLLRDIATGAALGNVTTLADASIVEQLKAKYEED